MEQRLYNSDNEYNRIGPALVAAIAEIPTIPKNAQAYGYKYATLDDILTVVKPILAKHKMALIQPLTGEGLETIIMHESGQCIRETVSLPAMGENKKMNAAQAVGATITYMRRYALSSILCISTDEDSDGAIGKKETTKPANNGAENNGSFSGFSTAAEVQRKSPQPVEPTPVEPTPVEPVEEKEKPAPDHPEIDWDDKVRADNDLCTKKQASYIFSLAQRAVGQDFELEDITGWVSEYDITEDAFVGLDAKVFCGRLQKRDATKVINAFKELAGIEG